MPKGPAARITDPVIHPLPPVLQPGPGSPTVLIGKLPAWRGVGGAAAAALQQAKAASDAVLQKAKEAVAAAALSGVPGALPAAKTAEETAKGLASTAMTATVSAAAGAADIHVCATPLPIPPHGPGVVVDGSQSVMINGLPACRMGDTIVEALGPPNKIAMGCPTVIIGG